MRDMVVQDQQMNQQTLQELDEQGGTRYIALNCLTLTPSH
jgi:hypothetical protein